MNVHVPFPSPGLPPAIWQEHRTPDGRTYYYNAATKSTQWTKPEEMMTPAEVSAAARHWTLKFRKWTLTNILCSAPSPTNHGKSILLKVAKSTGTIPRPRRALGRCQRPTRELWACLTLQQPRPFQGPLAVPMACQREVVVWMTEGTTDIAIVTATETATVTTIATTTATGIAINEM